MNKETLLNIIRQGEKLDIEFKSNFNIQVIETLVAFANTKGGKIYIGITDNRQIDNNFILNQETILNWLNEIKTKTQPSLIPDIEIIEIENKQIVEISIKEFPIKPVSYKGKYFKRVNNSNHQLTLSEISLMHLTTFNSSWDYYFDYNHSLNDISEEKLNNFVALWNQNHRTKLEESNFEFLQKLELVRENKITNACFLLFTKNETVITNVEVGRFQNPITIKDSISISSDLITEVNQIQEFILKHIRKEYIITGKLQRDEVWEYPLEAIREIVMNMIIHRDYMQAGDSIIKIYDDRIEFFNPGNLPDSITIEKLLNGIYISDCRNKLISKIFKEIGMVEKYGSGIRRIVDLFVNHECEKPIFENFQHGFRVTAFSRQKNKNIDNVPDNVTDVPDNVTDVTDNVTDVRDNLTDVTDNVTDNVTDATDNVTDVRDNLTDVTDNATDNVTDVLDNITDNVPDNRYEQITNLIKNNFNISTTEISEKLGISKRTVLRDIEKLKTQNKITRIGSEKGGHWQIIE